MPGMENSAEQKKLVYVRFPTNPSSYIFDAGELELRKGDSVLVNTEVGQSVARVVEAGVEVDETKLGEIKPIVRKLEEKDLARMEGSREKEREYQKYCRERIEARNLPMKLVRVEQAFDNSKTTFYFTSDGRVDFRDLLKDLVEKYRMRIELRQIGTRQETAMLGGIGACGRELCCNAYLCNFQRISVKMAKYQNMTLNPTKISGICGKLKCCLAYEKDVYSDLITNLPKVGKKVYVRQGAGSVVSINVIEQTFVARLEDRRFLKCNAADAMTEEEFLSLDSAEMVESAAGDAGRSERKTEQSGAKKSERRPSARQAREGASEGEGRKRSRRPRSRSRNKNKKPQNAAAGNAAPQKPAEQKPAGEQKRRPRRRPRNKSSDA